MKAFAPEIRQVARRCGEFVTDNITTVTSGKQVWTNLARVRLSADGAAMSTITRSGSTVTINSNASGMLVARPTTSTTSSNLCNSARISKYPVKSSTTTTSILLGSESRHCLPNEKTGSVSHTFDMNYPPILSTM